MPDGVPAPVRIDEARIGPNAILQLVQPLEALFGAAVLPQILNLAGVQMPTGQEMIPEGDAACVHRLLWQLFPDQGARISHLAGQGTARYIRTNRIPAPARFVLRWLPRKLAEDMLLRAIEDHAWTFCGSGALEAERQGPQLHFVLHDNPLADHHHIPGHPCHWHSAVFAELFTLLLGVPYVCCEPTCRGCGGDVCRFVVTRAAAQPALEPRKS